MHNQHSRNSRWAQAQSGQAIVLIAFAIIALIAILGLAVDGGGLYFLQRDAQNATDAAVIAAAYARCAADKLTDQSAITAAVQAAGADAATRNGFTDGQGGRTVTIQNPAPNANDPTDNHYVQVDITATKPSYFIQLVFKGPLKVAVRAIGYCRPPFDKGSVKAIMGLATTCTGNIIKWAGSTGSVSGGIYSNSNVQFTGSDNTLDGGVEAHTTVDNPASDNNTYTNPSTATTGVPVVTDPLAGVYKIADFQPNGKYAQDAGSDYHDVANEGSGYNITGGNTWKVNGSSAINSSHPMKGVYYFDGDVQLGNDPPISSTGITIVATGTITGQNLTGASYYSGGSDPSGLLFYSTLDNMCGSDVISVSGSYTQWSGVVYAPFGGVDISGSTLVLNGYIVAQTVTMDASNMTLNATPTVLPGLPPLVTVTS